ncbi:MULTISPECIES: hypothetical protein [Microbacterium]|uniref:hypothetical protein n=1 Tax=Microbacterium TaxID=33882 RepID=UPI000D64C71D|nr:MULTISPECIES: hypothetical protein [Microbacterium]
MDRLADLRHGYCDIALAVFGISLIIRSRRIFERLRVKSEEDGADLRRWMIVALGAVVLATAATSVCIAVSPS